MTKGPRQNNNPSIHHELQYWSPVIAVGKPPRSLPVETPRTLGPLPDFTGGVTAAWPRRRGASRDAVVCSDAPWPGTLQSFQRATNYDGGAALGKEFEGLRASGGEELNELKWMKLFFWRTIFRCHFWIFNTYTVMNVCLCTCICIYVWFCMILSR